MCFLPGASSVHLNNEQIRLLYPLILEQTRNEDDPKRIEWLVLAERFTKAVKHRHLLSTIRKWEKVYPEINTGFTLGIEVTPYQKVEVR